MYVNPFLAGIIMTVLAEVLIVFAYAVMSNKDKKDD